MIIRLINEGDLSLRVVYRFIKKVQNYLNLKKDIYLEIWDHESFSNYFTYVKEHPLIYDHYKDAKKPPQGYYKCEPDPKEQYYPDCYHNLSVCDGKNWKEILIHELIHAQQTEKVGWMIWTQCGDIFANDRENDPFECQASIMAHRLLEKFK